MKKTVKMVSMIMVAIMLLVCTFGYAESSENAPQLRIQTADHASGTHNGRTYTLDARQSSSTLIKSTGTYEVTINITLRFRPTFKYLNANNNIVTITGNSDIEYGPYPDTSLTKSYTVSSAASYYTIVIDGVTYNLSSILPNTATFSKCDYRLRLDSQAVVAFRVFY